MRLPISQFTETFLSVWNESTGHEYRNVKIMEKALKKVIGKFYTQAQLLEAARAAGEHPYWKHKSPYQIFHEENSKGYQDGIGELLSVKKVLGSKNQLNSNDRTNL